MSGHELFQYSLWKLYSLLKDFILFYIFIFIGEWFAEKRGYNLFERAWVITSIALFILIVMFWGNIGRAFLRLK